MTVNELPPSERLSHLSAAWDVDVTSTLETNSSIVAFGQRDGRSVVLKVVREPNDEWHSGSVLSAFGGRGVVAVIEHVDGAMLLERIEPGTPLVEIVRQGRDDDATPIIAGVIARMSPSPEPPTAPNVRDWARGFAKYRESGDTQLDRGLVADAEARYLELSATQRASRLLHGDLQHYNVLFDHDRGWLAIDPKGVVGEVEYEIGAAMRNPMELADLATDARTVNGRLDRFCDSLSLDRDRALGWTFAQAVLSAIWGVEDGYAVTADDIGLRLAATITGMRTARRHSS